MNRHARQSALLQLVREQELSTQAEVATALRDAGYDVVQTTVSRDLAELGLVKVRAASGRLVYAEAGAMDWDRLGSLGAALRRYLVSAEATGRLVVLVTPPGSAGALAQAMDEAGHPAIAGTIAGDNTIFVAVREGTAAADLRAELVGHLLEGAA